MAHMPSQERDRPAIVSVLDWWYDRLRASLGFLSDISPPPDDPGVSGFEILDLTRRGQFDADLLFRRLAMLHIDRDALAREDPLLYRELQGLCTLCKDKERCVLDLSREPDDPAWQDWRDYCPNSTMLSFLAVLQGASCTAGRGTPH